jgi:hypothetical protein
MTKGHYVFMKKDKRKLQKKGFWLFSFEWWMARYFSRSDPRIMIILFIIAVGLMIFGDKMGLIGGFLLLWYISTILIPALWKETLCRHFGSTWGTIIAFAPLWLPILLALSAMLWLPLFGLH